MHFPLGSHHCSPAGGLQPYSSVSSPTTEGQFSSNDKPFFPVCSMHFPLGSHHCSPADGLQPYSSVSSPTTEGQFSSNDKPFSPSAACTSLWVRTIAHQQTACSHTHLCRRQQPPM